MFLSLEKEIINVEKIDANIKQNPVLAIVEGKNDGLKNPSHIFNVSSHFPGVN